MQKIKIVIGQLGSPKTPAVKDVRIFLKEFLGDPRVVDINPLLWKIILNLFVLPFRPKKSAQAYSRIWEGSSFPLVRITNEFATELQNTLGESFEVESCFLLSSPRPKDIFAKWNLEDPSTRAQEVYIFPQFPQYSESTIASVFDVLAKELRPQVNIPSLHFKSYYHTSKAFIDESVRKIQEYLADNSDAEIVLSFHGIPLRRVLQKEDIYYRQCFETFYLISQQFDVKMHFCFQSRFGSEQWLGPATDTYVEELASQGVKKIGVYCPSFVVDCLETIDEIGHELAESVKSFNTQVDLIPCLNKDASWVRAYANYIQTEVMGTLEDKQNSYYQLDHKKMDTLMPKQKQEVTPLSKETKTSLKIVFFILFIDLIGFSIIFPMFPALAKHYLAVDSNNYFLTLIFGSIQNLTAVGADFTRMEPIVLFGGALGAIYSLLQFVFAPIWGSMSDKYGRRPILLFSISGLFISYVLWFFSGSFTTLILARFLGGVMSGNMSVASAVVADVTDEKNRSKGMAFIGIAFALGFILGPALGGIFSMIDLTQVFPSLANIGVNPFSMAALVAAVLTFVNLIFVVRKFKETLPVEKRGKAPAHRSSNPLKILKPLPYPKVNITNYSYFLFITAFAGMEFTLTFLAVERLSYTSMDNAYMFIFIGFIIALAHKLK